MYEVLYKDWMFDEMVEAADEMEAYEKAERMAVEMFGCYDGDELYVIPVDE